MKDTPKNFGLSQSLIDVVKNVVGEELKGGQKNLDANKNGKIDGEDFALLRKKKMKEEVEQIEELHSLKGKSLVDLKDMRDTARTKMNSHSKLSREYFRADKYSDGKKHQAIANQHEDDFNRIQKAIKSHPDYMKKEEVEEAVYTPKGYDESPVKGVDPRIVQPIKNLKKKPLPGEMGLKFGKMKEEVEQFDEARRTPEQEARAKRMAKLRASKSKAAQAAKAATKQHKEPDNEKKETKKVKQAEDPFITGEKETHPIMAARKAVSLGEFPYTHEDGKTSVIDRNMGKKIVAAHLNNKDKSGFEARLRVSRKSMEDAVKNPEGEAEKKTNPLDPKPLGKDFMARLSAAAARHKNKNK